MPKSYLSPSDRARIQAELDDIKKARGATKEAPLGQFGYTKLDEKPVDDGALARRQSQLTHVLETESPPKLDARHKNAAFRELLGLTREFEDNALTRQEQGLGYPEIMKKRAGSDIEFEGAKKKCLAWEFADRGQYVTGRMKELAGVIDPDNPELRNLENFRKAK